MPPVKSMDMSRSEFDWFRDKQFTTDFVTLHIPSWDAVLCGLRGRELEILEIGSWEGRSAVFWLEYFPSSHVTCIDTFSGEGEELDGNSAEGIEARFDANLAPYGQRVRKIKGASVAALPSLKGEKFDLIYIDGCHLRDETLVDSLLSWPLLAEGGHIIWDDYYFGADDGRPSEERPQQSIDVFIEMHHIELELLHVRFSSDRSASKEQRRETSWHRAFKNACKLVAVYSPNAYERCQRCIGAATRQYWRGYKQAGEMNQLSDLYTPEFFSGMAERCARSARAAWPFILKVLGESRGALPTSAAAPPHGFPPFARSRQVQKSSASTILVRPSTL